MARLHLSNLQLRSNLLTEDYQKEMRAITAFEVKDIWRRNPLLKDNLTPAQQKEWTSRLFDGDDSVSMAESDRSRAWFKQLAERVGEVLESLEGAPTWNALLRFCASQNHLQHRDSIALTP